MIRFMIDTDVLADLTGHSELLATYSDLVTDLPALRKRYPHSEVVLIDRGLGDPTGEASVFDVETGALTVASAIAHYDDAHKRGVPFLTVYHDRNSAAVIRADFGQRAYFNWFATLDGTAHIANYDPLHSPAVIQCLTATDLDYHADGNLVFEDNWHPTKAPLPLSGLQSDLKDTIRQVAIVQGDLSRMAAVIGG